MKDIPKKYLNTEERKAMWKDAKKILNKLDKDLSEVYVVGSAVSKKKSINDIDFAIVTRSKKKNQAYPVDLLILPENEDLQEYLDFLENYMKKRYGKAFKPIKLK